MSTQVQFRRGNTTQTNAFTGALSEITVDTDKKVVVVHDGVTAGGWPAPTLAFVQAAFDKANTTDISEAASFVTANAAYDHANGAFTKANSAYQFSYALNDSYNNLYATTNVVSIHANSGYTQANTATTNAATADSKAVSAGSYANSAYGQANTATTNAATADAKAVTSGSYANSAYTQANTATTNALAASTYANGAFRQANSSYESANAISIRADGAFVQANAAFAAANIGKTFVQTGGTINGSVTIGQDLSVSGNITFGGNSTSISSNNLTLTDTLIYVGANNIGNTADIGMVGSFTQGVYQHTAVFRDHLDGRWKFVSNVIAEPTTTIDSANGQFDIIKSGGIETTGYANIATVLYVGTETGSPLGGAINPVIAGVGNSTGYIQNYVYNTANGSASSADIAAYPNNGSDTSGWIDMGITSNNFTEASYNITGRNEGYIFMSAPSGAGTSGNLVFATDSTGTYNSIEFYVNGFGQGKTAPGLLLTTTKFKTNKQLAFSDNTLQNTAAAPFAYSNAAFLHANSAFTNSNSAYDKANSAYAGLTSDISANSLTTQSFVKLPYSKQSTNLVWANTVTANVLVDTIDSTLFGSAKYQIQITNATKYQVSELLVVKVSSSDALITEYAVVCSDPVNKNLGTYVANTAGGLINLYFNPLEANNRLIIYKNELSI